MTHPHLERLVARDILFEALGAMTDAQFAVAVLLLEGCNRKQIAAILGITQQAVTSRLSTAQRRVIHQVPELAHFLSGRGHRKGPYRKPAAPPLESGYLCAAYRTDNEN